MIKLLYKLFSKRFNSLVFEESKIHNNWKDHCTIYYIDTKGNKYYLFKDMTNNLPLVRLQFLNKLVALLSAGFKETDKDYFIDNWQKKIDNIVNTMDKNGRIKDLAALRSSLDLLKMRFDVLVEPDVFLSMMAVILIREDEDPAPIEISNSVIESKVKQFKEDDKLRDASFFLHSGLNQFIPYLADLGKNWNQYMEKSTEQLKNIKKIEKELFQEASKT